MTPASARSIPPTCPFSTCASVRRPCRSTSSTNTPIRSSASGFPWSRAWRRWSSTDRRSTPCACSSTRTPWPRAASASTRCPKPSWPPTASCPRDRWTGRGVRSPSRLPVSWRTRGPSGTSSWPIGTARRCACATSAGSSTAWSRTSSSPGAMTARPASPWPWSASPGPTPWKWWTPSARFCPNCGGRCRPRWAWTSFMTAPRPSANPWPR